MKDEKFEYQGKRKDQVESSYKGFFYSGVILIIVIVLGLLTSCQQEDIKPDDARGITIKTTSKK